MDAFGLFKAEEFDTEIPMQSDRPNHDIRHPLNSGDGHPVHMLAWLLLVLSIPVVCWGQGVTLLDSPDWHPIEQAQLDLLAKQIAQHDGRLVDASVHVGGESAMMMAAPIKPRVDKQSADAFISHFVQGVVEKGPQPSSQEPAKVGPLPGKCFVFEAQPNGKKVSMVAYVFFSNQEGYIITLYGGGLISKSDPVVTSYLSRIKVDASVVPGDINKNSAFGIHSHEDLIAYRLGQLAAYLCMGAFMIWFLLVIFRKRSKPPHLPLN